jgi:ABC-2 type transport system permease protein
MGFMSYVPVAVALNKEIALLGDWAMPASLAAGPITVVLAMLHWRFCLRNYQGAGG